MSESVELRTERLLLRPMRLRDVVDVYEYSQDEEWGRYSNPHTLDYVEWFVAKNVMAPWDTGPRFSIVIDANVVGGIGLEIDKANKIAEVGYSIAREHWGKGYVPEAAREVLRWGFEDLGLAKIYAHAHAENKRSWRVMEKLGMTREGLFRGHSITRGERTDDVYYGLLREEWEEQRKM